MHNNLSTTGRPQPPAQLSNCFNSVLLQRLWWLHVRFCCCVQDTSTAVAFLRCKKAYEVLSDCEQRRQYDEAVAAAGGYPSGQVRRV